MRRAVRYRDTSNRLLHPTYLPDLHPRSWLPTCLIEGEAAAFWATATLSLRSKDMAFSRRHRPLWRPVRKARRLLALFVRSGTSSPLTSRHPRGPRSAIAGRFAWKKVSLHPRILGCFLRALVKERDLHDPRCLPSVCVRAPHHASLRRVVSPHFFRRGAVSKRPPTPRALPPWGDGGQPMFALRSSRPTSCDPERFPTPS